jgi:glycosyltransferase involved in cell wall biosynthesis
MEKENIQMISLVIPLLNEDESIEKLHQKINGVLKKNNYPFEIIYIDDGSTDNSVKKIEHLRKNSEEKIKIIQFRRNFGKAAALSAGFKEAEGDLIITMDADLQDEPEEIPKMINKINEGYDLVSGWKQDRKDPKIKLFSSKIFNFTISSLTGIKLHDFNCGFKIYRREVIKNIDVYGELHRFLPVLAHQKGFKVGEEKVKHNSREYGISKYGRSGLRRIKNYILDTINIFLITKYSKKPLHFFGNVGLIFFLIGFVIESYLTFLRLTTGSIQNHTPLLMLGILLIIIGTQLISLGLLGEIIIRFNQKRDDVYSIKKKLV